MQDCYHTPTAAHALAYELAWMFRQIDAQYKTVTKANEALSQRTRIHTRTIERIRASVRAILAGYDETLPQKQNVLGLAMASRSDPNVIEPVFAAWYIRLERLYDKAIEERPREYSTTKHYAITRGMKVQEKEADSSHEPQREGIAV